MSVCSAIFTHILVLHLNNCLVVVIKSKLTKNHERHKRDTMCEHHMRVI